jgi:F-type H+-transporting ATPase subunit delta
MALQNGGHGFLHRPRQGVTDTPLSIRPYEFIHLQVDLVLIPAASGDFGVMPGHVPTVAQLRPGVIAIHKEVDKDVQKYFVSGGFAVAHADSTVEVEVVEAAMVEDLDKAAVKAGLAEYTARCLPMSARLV